MIYCSSLITPREITCFVTIVTYRGREGVKSEVAREMDKTGRDKEREMSKTGRDRERDGQNR